MNWLTNLIFPRRTPQDPALAAALQAWQALPEPDANEDLMQARWVVVDVEASGLNPQTDRLISIGAVALHGTTLSLSDSFDRVLKQDAVSANANILLHGIGDAAQREGAPPAQALLDFLRYLGKSRWVAYHTAFDQAMIARAMRTYLGLKFKRPTLDLAYLAPAVFADTSSAPRALDDWLTRFSIRDFARHNALSDAYASAQLLQIVLTQAQAQGLQNHTQLLRLQRAQLELLAIKSNRY